MRSPQKRSVITCHVRTMSGSPAPLAAAAHARAVEAQQVCRGSPRRHALWWCRDAPCPKPSWQGAPPPARGGIKDRGKGGGLCGYGPSRQRKRGVYLGQAKEDRQEEERSDEGEERAREPLLRARAPSRLAARRPRAGHIVLRLHAVGGVRRRGRRRHLSETPAPHTLEGGVVTAVYVVRSSSEGGADCAFAPPRVSLGAHGAT